MADPVPTDPVTSASVATEPATPRARAGRALHLVGAIFVVIAASGAALQVRRAAAPILDTHVVLVSIDTLRRDALGCYGSERAQTPAFDALARESVVFDQAVAAANFTAPSHATMLTGVSPAVHGVLNTVRSAPKQIPLGLPTLAERFRVVGYRTAADTGRGYVSEAFGFQRGFETFRAEFTGLAPKIDRALAWFDGLEPGRFGLYFLHTYETHAPYLPPREELDEILEPFAGTIVAPRIRALATAAKDQVVNIGHGALFEGSEDFTPPDVRCLEALYAATVRSVDRHLGRLVEGLRSRGLLERTLFIVTSDHGEEFRDHGDFQHESAFDEVLRVPLLMRFPGAAHAGLRIGASFPSVHLVPTLLDLLGLPAAHGIEGRSQAEAIRARHPDFDGPLAFAFQYEGEQLVRYAVRSPRWKRLHWQGDRKRPDTGYDLANDPDERHPMLDPKTPELDELLRELGVARNVWEAMAEPLRKGILEGEIDAELLEQLDRLGYIR